MSRAIHILGLVVTLLSQYGKTADDDPWTDYLKDGVEIDDMDEKKAWKPKYDEAKMKEGLATAPYDEPVNWLIESDDVYSVLLFGDDRFKNYRDGNCGGALLTINTVMTLCSCVASYLSWVLGPSSTYSRAPFALQEDLGPEVWVVIDAKNFSIYKEGDLSRYSEKHPSYVLLNGTGKGQLINEKCMEAYKDATEAFNKSWEQRTNIALLKFEPDYQTPTTNMFVPWPPIPVLYDLTLHDKGVKESNMWGVHRGRSPQTVKIPSYHYKPFHVVKRFYYDPYGNVVDIGNIRAVFMATLCDQDFCVEDFPDIDLNKPSEERRRISCFCDDNYADILCEGLHGSPVIHDGDLHGLLAEPLQCNPKHPRGTLAIAIHGPYMDYITKSVPGILDRLQAELNASQFREKAIVSNYEVFLPQADLLPQEITFTEYDVPAGRSFSFLLLPSLHVLSVSLLLCTVQFV